MKEILFIILLPLRLFYRLSVLKKKTVILTSRKIYYTRSNPDPKPSIIVDNLDRIGKKTKQIEDLDAKVSLIRANSLPQELVSLQDIEFDLKFEHSLFRRKSESDLKTVVLDPIFISFLEAKHKTITADSELKKVKQQGKLEEINATILKEIDEAIELAQLLPYTSKPSIPHSNTTTSSIVSTTSQSTDPFSPRLHL